MAVKKYLSLDRLTEYDALIKQELDSKINAVNTSITNITNGDIVVKEAEHATSANSATNSSNADKLGGQLPSYYAKASDIPTGALADKDVVSESDLNSALAEKINAASEGNHSHSNKTVLDGITSTKVSSWDSAEANAKAYADTQLNNKVDKVSGKGLSTNDYTSDEKTKLSGIETGAQVNTVTGVKGNSESSYRTGNINITKANIGLGNVDNTADADKNVKYATSAGSATSANSATKATQDASGNVITSTYETKADASSKLTSANKYTDDKIALLMNNSSEAVDSIMELATAMAENDEVVSALNDAIGTKVDKVDGKGLSTNDYTTTEKNKLAGIAAGAQVNQNAFSNVVVGSTTIAADSVTDSLTLVAGSNITITPDATNDKITIAATDTTYNAAGSALGLVKSGGDVSISDGVITVNDDSHNHIISNVDGLQAELDAKQATITGGASTITSSNLTASRALVSNGSGKVAVSAVTSTELGYLSGVTSAIQTQLAGKSNTGHSHDAATTSAAGFMTAAMVTKLNGIAEGANKITVDSALSSTSTNPVQNKVVDSAIVTVTGLITTNTNSINTHTTAITNLQTAVSEFAEITSAEIQNLFK